MKPVSMRLALETLAAAVLALLLLVAAGLAVKVLAPVVLLFALALVMAFVLEPFVSWCQRRLRAPRALAILAAYVLVVVVLGALGVLLAPPLLAQGRQLVDVLLKLVRGLTDQTSPLYAAADRLGLSAGLAQAVASALVQLEGVANDVARELFEIARGISRALLDALLVFVIGFYMLMARPRLGALPWLNHDHQPLVARIELRMAQVLARYLRARLLLSALVGILFGLAAQVIGLPYPVVLGAVAAVLDWIPFLGPVLGVLPALAVAMVQGPPLRALAVLAAFALIQQVEGNILAPKITGDAVRLHPLVVIFAVLAAAQVAGAWGAVLITPIAGCIVEAGREIAHAWPRLAGEPIERSHPPPHPRRRTKPVAPGMPRAAVDPRHHP